MFVRNVGMISVANNKGVFIWGGCGGIYLGGVYRGDIAVGRVYGG